MPKLKLYPSVESVKAAGIGIVANGFFYTYRSETLHLFRKYNALFISNKVLEVNWKIRGIVIYYELADGTLRIFETTIGRFLSSNLRYINKNADMGGLAHLKEDVQHGLTLDELEADTLEAI